MTVKIQGLPEAQLKEIKKNVIITGSEITPCNKID